jgi:hypothetical protein
VKRIEDLILGIDARWTPLRDSKQTLHIIGSGALMLQADYERGTKDSDVLHTTDLNEEVKARLVALAGDGTDLHQRHLMYIEVVAQGLPFLAQTPRWRARPEL